MHLGNERQIIFFNQNILFIGLLFITSVMYVIYFYGYDANEASLAPFILRFIPKLIGLGFFYLSCFRFFSLQAFFHNFGLKIPILFISFVTFLTIPYQDSAQLQAVNMLLFLPLLALDWKKDEDSYLLRKIFVFLIFIILLQAILDPVLKLYTSIGFANWGIVGGLGNSNSFSLFLLILATFSIVVLKKTLLFYVLCLLCFFTGSLTGMIISFVLLSLTFFNFFLRLKLASIFILLILIFISFQLFDYLLDLESLPIYRSFIHAYDKFISLVDVILFQANTDYTSSSISFRAEYNALALSLLKEYPLALIWGHPNSIPIYTGDGWWTALIVTHGLVVTIIFAIVNFLAVLYGLRLNEPCSIFCSISIIIICIFLLANRILDYWPVALIYFIVFGYITAKIKTTK